MNLQFTIQSIFISSLNSEKKKWLSTETKKCLKALALQKLADYLNLVTKHL